MPFLTTKAPFDKHLSNHCSICQSLFLNVTRPRFVVKSRKFCAGDEIFCSPDSREIIQIIALLKDCTKQKDVYGGARAHFDIIRRGLLGKNCNVASGLVNMYAKCGAFAKAENVLDELPVRDLVSWNALIFGYGQAGQGEDALDCFKRMLCEGFCPNAVTFIAILKACGAMGALDMGIRFHEQIVNCGLVPEEYANGGFLVDTNVKSSALGNSLVDMYVKCGALAKAAQVLDELPIRDVVSWSALIAGYVKEGQANDALGCYDRMRHDGIYPNEVTFICILKACATIGALDKGKQIHGEIVRQGLIGKSTALGNALVDMYAKCGALAKAAEVFRDLPVQDLISWNALISGYAEHEYADDALKSYQQMQLEGHSPDAVTFIGILKACGSIKATCKGEQIHNEIVWRGLFGRDIAIGATLVDMYVKCGALTKASRVLDKLPIQDVVSWSALIAGFAEEGKGVEALQCYEQMQRQGLLPNAVTFACLLKACGNIKSAEKGKKIHKDIVRLHMLGKDVMLGNALVDMYAHCGAFRTAVKVLDELPMRDAVSWNALIAGYGQYGEAEKALRCYESMQHEGLLPDAVTFICVLKACGTIGALENGEKLHCDISKQRLVGKTIMLDTTLVDMYAKCGALAKATQVLEKLPVRNVISWNALIGGYARQGESEEGDKCFRQMQQDGLLPNEVTLICILKVYGSIGAIDKGKQIHDEIMRLGLLENNMTLGNALLDMYVKCGALEKAAQVFDELTFRDIVSWGTLTAGYAYQGCGKEALMCLERMKCEGLPPNVTILGSVLTACSRSNLPDKCQNIFLNMEFLYGITPDIEHCTCMVDLFSRSGEFSKALRLMEKMLFYDHPPLWHALLGACEEFGNIEVGNLAFDNALQLDENDAAVYVLMSKIHTVVSMHADTAKIFNASKEVKT